MAGTLHAELTQDDKHIVMMAVGDTWEQRRLGEVLKLITPTLKKSKDVLKIEGGVVLPVTWPAVVQLEHTFQGDDGYGGGNGWVVYGPRLKQWILDELDARRDRDDPLPVKLPEGCVPRDYQVDGARSIAYSGQFLVLDDPGVGKTVTAILGLAWRQELGHQIFPAVVVVPSWGVGRAWAKEIAKWMPHWRTTLWTGATRADTASMPLGRLHGKVPTRVRNLLVSAGYKNVTEVRRALKRGELDTLPRLGTNGRRDLEAGLASLDSGDETNDANVFIVTYATARRDALANGKGPLLKIKAKSVVADEVHWIGNQKAKQTQAVQRVASSATTFVGLSGTVIRTDVRDLWPTLRAMDNASWPAAKRLTDRYCIKGNPDYGEEIKGLDPAREREFRDTLRSAMRRVAKADVLDKLPPKIYSVRRIAIPDEWREPYDQMEEDMLAELPDGQELPAFDVLTRMNHLSQMASSAFDVKMTEGPEVDENTGELKKHYHVILKEPCWKADELMEIMAERRGCAPIVCFAPSRQLVMLAGLRAEKNGYRVGYYTGLGRDPDHPDWPAITEKSRQAAFDAFQAGQLDLLCVTTQSGGTGLTLTAAGTAVFLRRPWELTDAIQAEDRVHRIGSEDHETFDGQRGVEIIDVRTIASVEQRVVERLREKGANLSELIQDPRVARELLGGL